MTTKVETIEILAIAFLVLCVLIMIAAAFASYYLVQRKKRATGIGSSYKLDHKYEGNYETSMYGNRPKIVVTKSTTRSENDYQAEVNGNSKEVISSYHNVAYENAL